MKLLVASIFLLGASGTAHAAACDALAGQAAVVKGEQVVPVFTQLAKCDAKLAEKHFYDFMRSSSDVGTLVALSLAAIDAQIYKPVWNMMEKVPDFSARDEVAKGVGASCADNAAVLPFLQGAYSALGDRQFNSWREALGTCDSPALVTWLEQTAAKPPSVVYDEKYNSVTDVLVKRKKLEALPILEQAAIAAGTSGGPFSTLLDRMADAVRPASFGAKIPAEDQAKLESALGRVAAAVPPEQARLVADRLYQNGSESAAAALLPRIYPERVQADGRLLYGVAAIEACDDEAVVHYATVTDAAKRWSIVEDVSGPALADFKPRLKCTAEGTWPLLTTPEPLATKAEVDGWAEALVAEWASKGLTAKVREEKALELN